MVGLDLSVVRILNGLGDWIISRNTSRKLEAINSSKLVLHVHNIVLNRLEDDGVTPWVELLQSLGTIEQHQRVDEDGEDCSESCLELRYAFSEV